MKNAWLRAEEQAARCSPVEGRERDKQRSGCKQLQLRERTTLSQMRPKTSPALTQRRSRTEIAHQFAVRKDNKIETIRTPYQTSQRVPMWNNSELRAARNSKRSKTLLEGVLKRECNAHDGIPKPGNHIMRKFEKEQHPKLERAKSIPRFSFVDENFLTFGTFDTTRRPEWNDNQPEVEFKWTTNKDKHNPQYSEEQNNFDAITATVKDVLRVYSEGVAKSFIKENAKFSVPVYLNNHEIHAWRTLSNHLFTNGDHFTMQHMCDLADICAVSMSTNNFKIEHPEVFHFICYCNLLLGGTKSFSSAKLLLLSDMTMLLKFMKQVNPLNVPIENLRLATAFRLRESKNLQQQQQQHLLVNQSISLDVGSSVLSSKASIKSKKPPKYYNKAKDFPPWEDNTSVVSATQSKLTLFTSDYSSAESSNTIKTAKTSVFVSLPQKLSSWTLSFSLLARIMLVSVARTPQAQLHSASRNKDAASDSLLVETESVHFTKHFVNKVIAEKEPTFTRLPPPEAKGQKRHQMGLFDGSWRRGSVSRKRATLNHLLHQHAMQHRRNSTMPFKAEVSTSENQPDNCLEENSGGGVSFTRAEESNKKLLTAQRTTKICEKFRSAQRFLVHLQRSSRDFFAHSALYDDDSSEDEDDDEDEDDEYFKDKEDDDEDQDTFDEEEKEGPSDDEKEEISFMQLMYQKSQEMRAPLRESILNPEKKDSAIQRQESTGSEKFFLYADMMNEAESIDLLSKSSGKVRAGVLGSLTSKQDQRREQGRWKETKADEDLLFTKNIERNKDFIEDVLRMYHLRSQVSPTVASSNYQDFGSIWRDHLEKQRQGEATEKQTIHLEDTEKKILSMLQYQETKEDYNIRMMKRFK